VDARHKAGHDVEMIMATSSAQPKPTNVPNDLEPYWVPFTANRAF